MWSNVVEISRDQLSGVTLVLVGLISEVRSTVRETDIPGAIEAPSVNKGGGISSVEVPVPAS